MSQVAEPPRPFRSFVPALVTALWAAAVAAGTAALAAYANQPGVSPSAPSQWPATSSFPRPPDAWTLLVFAHPHCPCTRATMSELARLQIRFRAPVRLVVCLYRPDGEPDDWACSSIRDAAAGLPDAIVRTDPGGRDARRFGVHTSGSVLLYDRDGRLAFEGGLTPARGHEGFSIGQEAILNHMDWRRGSVRRADVFGCGLCDSTDQENVR